MRGWAQRPRLFLLTRGHYWPIMLASPGDRCAHTHTHRTHNRRESPSRKILGQIERARVKSSHEIPTCTVRAVRGFSRFVGLSLALLALARAYFPKLSEARVWFVLLARWIAVLSLSPASFRWPALSRVSSWEFTCFMQAFFISLDHFRALSRSSFVRLAVFIVISLESYELFFDSFCSLFF